jgi:hypothetical protein
LPSIFYWTDEQLTAIEPMFTGEQTNMLPQANTPAGKSQRRNNSGIPYLKSEHLTKDVQSAKILAVKADPEGKFGPGVVLKLALSGILYFWTVTTTNPNYAALTGQFGLDENDWAGKAIGLNLEKDDFSEKFFPHVSFPKVKG